MRQKIKKAAVGVLAAAMMLSTGVTTAFAAGPGCGRNFVDADGDGICDYAGSACRYIDSDNDGICDNCDQSRMFQNGCGRNFIDADGDGVCDNYGDCDNYGVRHGRGGCGRRNR